MTAREIWGSRFGFIMAAAGSAIGLGNIWRFPYVAGTHGGAAFLLIYLAIVILFGLSLVMAEMVVGRTAQKNPVGALRALGGRAWPLVGYVGLATGFVILSFYIVVAGWCLAYIVLITRGALAETHAAALTQVFNGFVSDPIQPVFYAGLFMALTAWVVAGGVGAGIERANKVLMPALFVLLIVLVARAVTLPGAEKGIAFYLVPKWHEVNAGTFQSALAQAFFSLSLGMGTMLTYGSYLSKDENLPSAAFIVVLLDTAVAVLAGMMVLPAVFSAGLEPTAGPGLTFITLPAVFAAMPAGRLFGVLFFALLAIAALTSSVSMLEPMAAYFIDEHGAKRRKAVWLISAASFLLGIPASLSFGAWSGFKIAGRTWFDNADFLANSLLLPLGGFFIALFVGWAWSARAVRALCNEGRLSQPWAPAWLFVLRFAAPIGIAWILFSALR